MYEIQLHPADIRRQVRYYFLSRRAFYWLAGVSAGLAVVVLAGVVMAPFALRTLLQRGEVRALRQQHQLQLNVLEQRTAALTRTERGLESARNRERQMGLILGLPAAAGGPAGAAGELPLQATVPAAADALRRGLELDTASRTLLDRAGELAAFARSQPELTAGVPSICPVPVGSFVLTSPFGERLSPFTNAADFHAGIDLAAREGTPVVAAGGGRVAFAGSFPLRRHTRWWRYGNVVVLSHHGGYLTVYGHLRGQHRLEHLAAPPLRGAGRARGPGRGRAGRPPDLHSQLPVEGARGAALARARRAGGGFRPAAGPRRPQVICPRLHSFRQCGGSATLRPATGGEVRDHDRRQHGQANGTVR
ncbi:MAG: peptidase family protein [Acidobacteria bacterium]|nr:peptidase family protein [Acidobacteriota bacterium]